MKPTKFMLNAYPNRRWAHAALRELKTGEVNLAMMEHREADTLTLYRAFASPDDAMDVMGYVFQELNVFGITDQRILELLQSRVR